MSQEALPAAPTVRASPSAALPASSSRRIRVTLHHSVTASITGTDKYGRDEPSISATLTYNCSATSSQVSAAEVKAPALGGEVSSFITPPNTGDAGLRAQSGESSSTSLALAVCGALILLVVGLGWRIRAFARRR